MLGKLGTQTLRGKTFKRKGVVWVENRALAKELKVLIHLGNHENVVNVLAACTLESKLMVVFEYCSEVRCCRMTSL